MLKAKMNRITTRLVLLSLLALLLQACSGNGFQLRKNLDLPAKYQRIQFDILEHDHELRKIFEAALEEAGGRLQDKAPTVIKIENFREGRRIVAYNKQRKAREFLIYLKFDYRVEFSALSGLKALSKRRVNIDQVFIYDSDYALGKVEEENQIRQDLYAEASRLILLRLQHSKEHRP